jgi:YD repeat-containing protein
MDQKCTFLALTNSILLSSLMSLVFPVYGQTTTGSTNLIPPSPELSALFRFVDYPMDNSTGIPKIAIPIYELKVGEISVPISMGYHSSGRRVSETTGPIGLGWSLFAGGAISRVVYGKADEDYAFVPDFKSAGEITNSDYEYLYSISDQGIYDTEHDVFSYSFGTRSGKFIMHDGENIFIPKSPIKIADSSWTAPQGMSLIDELGNIYSFYDQESLSGGTITGWYLSTIISANKADTIVFKYSSKTCTSASKIEQQTVHSHGTGTYYMQVPNGGVTAMNNGFVYSVRRLKEISARNGKVLFQLGADSTISTIEIYNSEGIIKSIDLYRSQLQFNSYTNEFPYKLDSLHINDTLSVPEQKYSFEYYTSHPVGFFCNDYWGFLNSVNRSHGVPYQEISLEQGTTTVGFSEAIKTSVETYAKSAVLRKIIYPTGGYTEFSYESNKSKPGQDIVYCGGLRVSQIKTKDPGRAELVRTYRYGIGENGLGTIPYWANVNSLAYQKLYFEIIEIKTDGEGRYLSNNGAYKTRVYTSDFLPDIAYIANMPISYSSVTEYLGTVENNSGKVTYEYDASVNEIFDTNAGSSTPSDAKAWDFRLTFPFLPPSSVTYNGDYSLSRAYINLYNYWDFVPLIFKTEYQRIGSEYYPVRSTQNIYSQTITDTIAGLHLWKYIDYYDNGWSESERQEIEQILINKVNNPVYQFANYFITNGKRELSKTIITNYNQHGLIVDSTRFIYNSFDLLSQKMEFLDNNKIRTTAYKYPFDYPYSDMQVPGEMLSRNMIDYKLEINLSLSGDTLSSRFTKYKITQYGDMILPEKAETVYGNSGDSIRYYFNHYSTYGNLLESEKENDLKTTYLWGYNHTYPVAIIENASLEDVQVSLGGSIPDLGDEGLTVSQITSLRSGLPNALITTYTYKPLVGQTSKTDPNGITTYYEYDSNGRLSYIRDSHGKIIKHASYNYKLPE